MNSEMSLGVICQSFINTCQADDALVSHPKKTYVNGMIQFKNLHFFHRYYLNLGL